MRREEHGRRESGDATAGHSTDSGRPDWLSRFSRLSSRLTSHASRLASGVVDEAELVRRARAGDQGAYGELVRREQAAIYRLAERLVGAADAEDVAQRAFLKAWQGLDGFAAQGGASFGTWLYRIAVNCGYDHLRQVARSRTVPLATEALTVADECDVAETVVGQIAEAEWRAAVTQALPGLAAEDRLLLALRVGEGLSYEAIGAILALKPPTVGSRLSRARARLHRLTLQALAGQEGDDGVR